MLHLWDERVLSLLSPPAGTSSGRPRRNQPTQTKPSVQSSRPPAPTQSQVFPSWPGLFFIPDPPGFFQTAPFSLETCQENALSPRYFWFSQEHRGKTRPPRSSGRAGPASLWDGSTGRAAAPGARTPVEPRSAPLTPRGPRPEQRRRCRRGGGAHGRREGRDGRPREGSGRGRELPAALSPSAVCPGSPRAVAARGAPSPRSWSHGTADCPELEWPTRITALCRAQPKMPHTARGSRPPASRTFSLWPPLFRFPSCCKQLWSYMLNLIMKREKRLSSLKADDKST